MREKIEKILEHTISKYSAGTRTDQGTMDALVLIQTALNVGQMYNQYEAGKLEVQRLKSEIKKS